MKKNLKRLILILSSLFMILSFQNCKVVKNEENTSSDCTPSLSEECLALNAEATSYSMNLNQTFISFGKSSYDMSYEFKVSLADDQVLVSNYQCSLSSNEKWLQAKSLYLNAGVCHFSFEKLSERVTCMAMAIPYAAVTDSNMNQMHLETPMCQNDYDNLCGLDEAKQFKLLLDELSEQLRQNKACN